MRGLILSLALVVGGAAQADEGAIRGVIDSQLDAFRADDFARAFTYAAPGIKGMFGGPDRFGAMVRGGFPMVWRPGRVEYLGTDVDGAVWRQGVMITDAEGRLHNLEYTMIETEEGWKIAGVRILSSGDPAV